MWSICKYMPYAYIYMYICHTSEVYACSTLFKVSLRIPADLNCADRSVYLRHHFCAEVHTLLAVAVGYPCGKLPWLGRYTNTCWMKETLMTWNSDGMWRMWISPKIYPKKQASMVIGMWEWHAWQMLTAASMAGCSHDFLGQNSAPVWSTCQSFQIKSSTQTERLYKNIQYTSVYMQKQLTQMTLYDVIMSVPQDGFDGFVTKDGSDSPLFTLCSYSEPLQQPARSVSKSSNNNWRAHLVMAWNWLPDTGWVRSSKLWHLRDCPWAQKHGVRHFNFSAQRLGGKVFGAFFVGLTWRFANPSTLNFGH